MVALFHFEALGRIHGSVLVHNAGLFVDFFFVLSGFVIAANYRERLGTAAGVREFMIMRWGRGQDLSFAFRHASGLSGDRIRTGCYW
jgi:peptidoglycan/LPS O-acetylase OafA/YrhL